MRRRRDAPSRSRCARCRSEPSVDDPNFRGGDYYDAEARPAGGACRWPAAIGQISYRTELELHATVRNRGHQNDEDPLTGGRYTVESYLEYHGEKLARRFDANTYVVLSFGDEPSRRRPGLRGGRSGARPDHAQVTLAGISSDRLYPLRLQQELAELIPGASQVQVIDSLVGHDGFLVEGEAVGAVIRQALDP